MVNGWLYRYQSCISQPGQVVTNGVSNTPPAGRAGKSRLLRDKEFEKRMIGKSTIGKLGNSNFKIPQFQNFKIESNLTVMHKKTDKQKNTL